MESQFVAFGSIATTRVGSVANELVNLVLISRQLEEYFECEMAKSGDAALCSFDLAHMLESPYSLICLDIMMPGMDGLQVLKHIREAENALVVPPDQEAKVMIISSDAAHTTILKSFFDCGASSYLTKPINRKKMIQELMTLNLINLRQ